jgi:ATP-binding cassette subfamily B protein
VLDPTSGGAHLATAMVLLAVATSLSASSGAMQAQQQRLLGEQVAQVVWDRILDVASRVDMAEYEAPGFSTRLERIQHNAVNRPTMVATGLLSLSGSLLGAVAMVVVIVGTQPVLLPILLAAGLPAALVARRVGRLEFRFAERITPVVRRRFYIRQLLSTRAHGAELRAFDSRAWLQAVHMRRLRVTDTSDGRSRMRMDPLWGRARRLAALIRGLGGGGRRSHPLLLGC